MIFDLVLFCFILLKLKWKDKRTESNVTDLELELELVSCELNLKFHQEVAFDGFFREGIPSSFLLTSFSVLSST